MAMTVAELSRAQSQETKDAEDTKSPLQTPDDSSPPLVEEFSWKLKIPMVLCALVCTLGSTYSSQSFAILKSTIKSEIPGITNARFGALASADALINGVLLLVSGPLVDYYGAGCGGVVCGVFICLGSVVRAVGAMRADYTVLLGGQILFGIGNKTQEMVQAKIYAHCYQGTPTTGHGYIGLITGLDIAAYGLFSVLGRTTAVPVGMRMGVWYGGFWLGSILCGFGLALNITYAAIERRLSPSVKPLTGRNLARRPTVAQDTSTPLSLAQHVRFFLRGMTSVPAGFWVIAMTQLLQTGVTEAYTTNLAEVVELTRGSTKLVAGYTSSVNNVIPIIMTPLWGLFFDLCGHRTTFISATSGKCHLPSFVTEKLILFVDDPALWVLVFALLAYTSVHPLIPVVLGSLAFSATYVPFLASLPLLVPSQESLGTATGIWRAFNAAGTTVAEVSIGAIQDTRRKGPRQYDGVFIFLIAMKAFDACLGLGYQVLDRRYLDGILTKSERSRIAWERSSPGPLGTLRRPIRGWLVAGLATVILLIVASYVLYIVYFMNG